MTQDTTLAEVREALATTLSNADLDGPDPDDYWEYLASKALAKLVAMPDRIAELEVENARLRELLKDLRDDLNHNAQVHLADPYILGELRSLCERAGYGNVMNSASALWRDALGNTPGGEFVSGSCRATVVNQVKRIDEALKGATKP